MKGQRIKSLRQHIIKFAAGIQYFSISELRKDIDQAGVSYTSSSLKQTLYSLKKNGHIHNSGRGWYSTISEPFHLNTEAITGTVSLLKTHFPSLPFACWSTQQIASYFHHLPGKFITFIDAENAALPSVYDFLIEHYSNVYLNPTPNEARKNFRIMDDTLVLRPAVSEEPRKDRFALIEKILVDLYFEKERLDIIDGWEYGRIFENVAKHFRIEIAVLLRYAQRRKIRPVIIKMLTNGT